ncbi:MAG: hypothetical protein JXB48_10870 [Candidatus Latescibacteria bacterium]|nr:hypothetical protein [Candidatus Latescibacterota bacterium]
MSIKTQKTYICLEPGEMHPVLCILTKYTELVGRLNPVTKFQYDIRTLEILPVNISHFDLLELIKLRMKSYVMGDIRFILGCTYIKDSMMRFFEGTSLKPVKITITGDQESYKDNFMLYVPYSELLDSIDSMNDLDALNFSSDIPDSLIREDDDCDLALGMVVWYAFKDTEQIKGKNVPGLP